MTQVVHNYTVYPHRIFYGNGQLKSREDFLHITSCFLNILLSHFNYVEKKVPPPTLHKVVGLQSPAALHIATFLLQLLISDSHLRDAME